METYFLPDGKSHRSQWVHFCASASISLTAFLFMNILESGM
jgi:hypothetical protein